MSIPASYDSLWSSDRAAQNAAYSEVLALSTEPVDWAYEVWDDVVAHLSAKDNHDRSIAAQVLCRLAKSDPDGRMRRDFAALLAVTRDERFVTARHALQALWQVGVAGDWQREMLLGGLGTRFAECDVEKNCTLIRYDIAVVLRRLYDETGDTAIRDAAESLIATETDEKYRKKYSSAWR
jgi:hypothetical protein